MLQLCTVISPAADGVGSHDGNPRSLITRQNAAERMDLMASISRFDLSFGDDKLMVILVPLSKLGKKGVFL